jgi:hypothetical protein
MVGGLLLIALVVGANLLNVFVSRSLSRTNEQVSTAGATMTTVANVGREANFVAVAAAQLPDRQQLEQVGVHRGLLVRQIDVAHAKLAGTVGTEVAMSEVDLRLAELEHTLDSLGPNPLDSELHSAGVVILAQADTLELATKHLYDGTEVELFKVGRSAASRNCQYLWIKIFYVTKGSPEVLIGRVVG